MSDRLAELRRQRAMVAEQLAWLDREIASADGKAPVAAPLVASPAPVAPLAPILSPAPSLPTVSVPSAAVAPEVAAAADAILDEYRVKPDSLRSDVKKGCFLYFGIATVLLVVCVAILYFALRQQ